MKKSIFVSQGYDQRAMKITASMHFPWAVSEKYQSFAWFTADSNGSVDLSKHKPDSGTYDYIDSMGLITSLQKINSEGGEYRS